MNYLTGESVNLLNMNTSLNPFLTEGLDDSLNLDQPLHNMMHQQLQQFGHATQTSTPHRSQPTTVINPSQAALVSGIQTQSGIPQTFYVAPVMQTPIMTEKLKKFSGYMHEDGPKFLSEFESFLTLSGVTDDERIIAAFHLHLKGPALIWYHTLMTKDSWPAVKAEFQKEFGNNINDPRLISEAAAFDNLKLSGTQAIEEFHSIVLEKGTRLGKTDRDMTNKFVNGLPSQLAFFIRAGRIDTFRDALHSAKIGEAHGYRVHTQVPSVPNPSDTPQLHVPVPTQVNALTPATSEHQGRYRKPQPRSRVCYSCSGAGHFKSRCNWNGVGSPEPTVNCQLCLQKGHAAPSCKKLKTQTPKPNNICQLCASAGHTARECPSSNPNQDHSTLNPQGLGTMPNSQA